MDLALRMTKIEKVHVLGYRNLTLELESHKTLLDPDHETILLPGKWAE